MPNEVKLQEGHPLDENLRPIKVGGKSSAIETAQHGNGARVNGDLEVTGDTYATIEKMYLGLVPAYAGMILGYTRIQNDGTGSTDNIITIGTSMTVLATNNGTDISVTFTAPPSGNVEIRFSCYLLTSSTTVAFALSDNSTFNEVGETHTYDAGAYRMDETDYNLITIPFAVAGLTAGTSYTYYIAGEEISGSTATIYHGRFRTGGKHYPPIIVKAIALPATITTGE